MTMIALIHCSSDSIAAKALTLPTLVLSVIVILLTTSNCSAWFFLPSPSSSGHLFQVPRTTGNLSTFTILTPIHANPFKLWNQLTRSFLQGSNSVPALFSSRISRGTAQHTILQERNDIVHETSQTATTGDANPGLGLESSSSIENQNQSAILSSIIAPLAETEKELQRKCYGPELGNACIENSAEWFHFLHRPINLLPFDRIIVNTRFYLVTTGPRNNTNNTLHVQQVFTNSSEDLIAAGYNAKASSTKFIVHGFIDTGASAWVTQMARALMQIPADENDREENSTTFESKFNVIIVDWGGGSLPLYTQATANARLVGLELGHFIKFLRDKLNVRPGTMHIIGHSLGSHIGGYAGSMFPNEKLGRITGLDPAEPYFQFMPTFVRLDPNDAKFVDVIHTDGRTILLLGYGMIEPCGHIDFYPNDGKEQPGCELTKVPLNLLQHSAGLPPLEAAQRELFACNHNRAIFYFIDSVVNSVQKARTKRKASRIQEAPQCPFVAHACLSYSDYLKGDCWSCGQDGSLCATMGLDNEHNIGNNSLVKFFMSTGGSPPFCLFHYRLTLQLAFPLHVAAEWVTGNIRVSVLGKYHTLHNINLTPEGIMRLDHGKNYSFLLQSSKPLGPIQNVRLEWKYNYKMYDVLSTCWSFLLCNNKLFVKALLVTDMDDSRNSYEINKSIATTALCGEPGTTYTSIHSGNHATFVPRSQNQTNCY